VQPLYTFFYMNFEIQLSLTSRDDAFDIMTMLWSGQKKNAFVSLQGLRDFSLFQESRETLQPSQPSVQTETVRSAPSRAKFKNKWSHTSSHLYASIKYTATLNSVTVIPQ